MQKPGRVFQPRATARRRVGPRRLYRRAHRRRACRAPAQGPQPAAPARPDPHRARLRLLLRRDLRAGLIGCLEVRDALAPAASRLSIGLIRCSTSLAGASSATENRVHFSVRRASGWPAPALRRWRAAMRSGIRAAVFFLTRERAVDRACDPRPADTRPGHDGCNRADP